MKQNIDDFGGKSIRKDMTSKKKKDATVVNENGKPKHEPYKKPKMNFKNYIDHSYDEDGFWDEEDTNY